MKLLTTILAWTLGLTFVFSGFLKAVDPYGGALKINEYLTEFGLTVLVGFEILKKPAAFVSFTNLNSTIIIAD